MIASLPELTPLRKLLADPRAILWDIDQKRLVHLIEVEGSPLAVEIGVIGLSSKAQTPSTNAIMGVRTIDADAIADRSHYTPIQGDV